MLKRLELWGFLVFSIPLIGQPDLQKITERIAGGDVPVASVTEVAVNPSYIRLDAREKEEYWVSHLPEARYIGYKDFDASAFASLFPDKKATYVVYCSVGIRSRKIGRKLMSMGYANVKNLSGGIFKWVNEGYDILDNEGKVTLEIHAYNRYWGSLLNRGEKVY
jgi:rhodanese-related sulfurtransferase